MADNVTADPGTCVEYVFVRGIVVSVLLVPTHGELKTNLPPTVFTGLGENSVVISFKIPTLVRSGLDGYVILFWLVGLPEALTSISLISVNENFFLFQETISLYNKENVE